MSDVFALSAPPGASWLAAPAHTIERQPRSGVVTDESDLVARAREGDTWAFERLFEQYHAPILNYLHRMVGDRAMAEDLTQDSFVKAYRALPGTKPDLAFKAWLYRIATNTAISQLRRRKVLRFLPFLPTQDFSSGENVERSVGHRHDVEQALKQLPEHYAAVLILRHYEGLSLAETAEALGITENAAKLRLFRARKVFASVYSGPVPAEGNAPAGEWSGAEDGT